MTLDAEEKGERERLSQSIGVIRDPRRHFSKLKQIETTMAQKTGKKIDPTNRAICRSFAAAPIKIFDRFTSSTSLSDRFMLSIDSCHRSFFAIH